MKEVETYQGFILPKKDVIDLKANGFEYDTEEECFKGMIEDAEGALRSYQYFPANFFWNEVVDLENY